jgi:hypothetical protein
MGSGESMNKAHGQNISCDDLWKLASPRGFGEHIRSKLRQLLINQHPCDPLKFWSEHFVLQNHDGGPRSARIDSLDSLI